VQAQRWCYVCAVNGFDKVSDLLGVADDETLLQHIFRLLHPFGTYHGPLSNAVAKATQKGGLSDTLPRVLVVKWPTGVSLEWAPLRGAVEPVVCPDARTVMVRRGDALEYATIDVSSEPVRLSAVSTSIRTPGVRKLYGCTQSGASKQLKTELWVESTNGEIGIVKTDVQNSSISPLPVDTNTFPAMFAATAVQKLQSVRGDGTSVYVRGKSLVFAAPAQGGESSAVVTAPFPFDGTPAWVGDSDYLVVTERKD
jgi:hypothetical protein